MTDTLRQQLELADKARIDQEEQIRGLKSAVRGLRSHPDLASWTTLESVALVPWAQRLADGKYHILLPVAVPVHGTPGLWRPWGWTRWSWPSSELIEFHRLKQEVSSVTPVNETFLLDSEEIDELERQMVAGEEIDPPDLIRGLLSSDLGSVSATRPGDMLDIVGLSRWLEKARELVGDQPTLRGPWELLERRVHRGHFELVVVGETGRGKTSTIQELLGCELEEVDPDRPIRLIAQTDGLTARRDDVRKAPDPSSDTDGQTDLEDAEPMGGLVELRVPSPWMSEQDVQILELPSRSLEEDSISVQGWKTADFVFLVLQATAPFAHSEQLIVQKALDDFSIPWVALVLRHLDRVPEADRARVVEFVRDRAHKMQREISVAIAGPGVDLPDSSEKTRGARPSEIVDLAALRSSLVDRKNSQSHRRGVGRQLLKGGTDFLQRAKEGIDLRVEQHTFEHEQRESERKRARLQARQKQQGLESVAQAWSLNRLEALDALSGELDDHRRLIVTNLKSELGRVANPKAWLDNELTRRLESELKRAQKALDSSVNRRFREDHAALVRMVKDLECRLKTRPHFDLPLPWGFSPSDIDPEVDTVGVDPNLMKRLTRITAATVGTVFFWKLQLMALLPTTLVSMLGDDLANSRVEAAKSKIGDELSVEIERRARDLEAESECAAVLKRAYDTVLAELRAAQKPWRKKVREFVPQKLRLPRELANRRRLVGQLANELKRLVADNEKEKGLS